MVKKIQIGIIVIIALFSFSANAQSNKCGTMQQLHKSIANDPTLKQRMLKSEKSARLWNLNHLNKRKSDGNLIIIPTVVHVIWNSSIENVSDEQIRSQIDVLNNDFRLMNEDSLDDQHPFHPFVVDTKIEFCLAQQDENGNATNGITRTQTNVISWKEDNWDDIKSTDSGGKNNWDPEKYLNIYVVNIDGGILGFASFPDELQSKPDLDGVVIRFEAFGTKGTAGSGEFAINDKGRTGTHEVGHWLNLRHIWGDTACGDDFVDDTEKAEKANFDKPVFPHRANNQCGSGDNGEMYMNFMDYVDDSSMVMFTSGQASRMSATLNGLRVGLLTSNGCELTNVINDLNSVNSVMVYPNPNNGQFILSIDLNNHTVVRASIINMLGGIVKDIGIITKDRSPIDITDVQAGAYYLRISNTTSSIIKKVFITE